MIDTPSADITGITNPNVTFDFLVEFFLNTTPDPDPNRAAQGALATFSRFRPEPLVQAADTFEHVIAMTITAPNSLAVLEDAFDVGNGEGDSGMVERYYATGARSLSVGDVVKVHTPDGCPVYAVERFGWAELAVADFDNLHLCTDH